MKTWMLLAALALSSTAQTQVLAPGYWVGEIEHLQGSSRQERNSTLQAMGQICGSISMNCDLINKIEVELTLDPTESLGIVHFLVYQEDLEVPFRSVTRLKGDFAAGVFKVVDLFGTERPRVGLEFIQNQETGTPYIVITYDELSVLTGNLREIRSQPEAQ